MAEKNAAAYLKSGIEYCDQGDFDRGIADISQAILQNPDDSNAHVYRSIAYRTKRDYKHSWEDMHKAISLDPNNAFAYSTRGAWSLDTDEYGDAVKDFEMALQLQPNNNVFSEMLIKAKALLMEKRRIAKRNCILTAVFSGIGIIIGLIMMEEASMVLAYIWLFSGIGGNLIVTILEKISDYIDNYHIARKEGGSFFSSIAGAVFLGIILILLKSVAGPIFPIIKIVGYAKAAKQ